MPTRITRPRRAFNAGIVRLTKKTGRARHSVRAMAGQFTTFAAGSGLPALCPKDIFVRPRMDACREESRRIMEIIASTGATGEQMSVDEAGLDPSAPRVSNWRHLARIILIPGQFANRERGERDG